MEASHGKVEISRIPIMMVREVEVSDKILLRVRVGSREEDSEYNESSGVRKHEMLNEE